MAVLTAGRPKALPGPIRCAFGLALGQANLHCIMAFIFAPERGKRKNKEGEREGASERTSLAMGS